MPHLDKLPKEAGFIDSADHFQYNVRIRAAVIWIHTGNEHLGSEEDFSWCALYIYSFPPPPLHADPRLLALLQLCKVRCQNLTFLLTYQKKRLDLELN